MEAVNWTVGLVWLLKTHLDLAYSDGEFRKGG